MSEIIAARATSRRGLASLEMMSGEVEDHGGVFVAFAPGPGFGDVVVVFEAKNEVVRQTASYAIIWSYGNREC